MIRVGVFGAGGRMGSTVCRAVHDAPDMELVAAVDPHHAGIDLDQLGVHGTQLQVAAKAERAATTRVSRSPSTSRCIDAARDNLALVRGPNGVHAVVGTTGFSEDELAELATCSRRRPPTRSSRRTSRSARC